MIAKTMCRVRYTDLDIFKPRDILCLHINKVNINIVEVYRYLYRQSRSITILEIR